MPIVFKEPVKGRREHIFKGDQAEVNRIWTKGKYNGLVERRCQREDFRFKYLEMNPDERGDFKKRQPHISKIFLVDGKGASVMKYIATKFANIVFPENFVNYRELRIGRECTNIYSDFVEDTNDAVKRKKEAMQKFYIEEDHQARTLIREDADRKENELSPSLKAKIDEVHEGGIYLKHPEANYQIDSEGKGVFFEVDGIELHKALDYSYQHSFDEGVEMLALLGAFLARRIAKAKKDRGSGAYERIFEKDLGRVFEAQMNAFEEYRRSRESGIPFPFLPVKIEYYFWRESKRERQSALVQNEIAEIKNKKIEKL